MSVFRVENVTATSETMILLQNITTATTEAPSAPAAAPAASSAMSPFITFLPLLIMVPFLFMTFRRQKKEDEARGGLKRGDKVVVNGIVGEFQELEGRLARVKIANNVLVSALLSSVNPLPESAKEDPLKDLKASKMDPVVAEKK